MNAVCRYLFSLIVTVVLCGIMRMLIPDDKRIMTQLVTGLVITVVMLSPVLTNEKIKFEDYFDRISVDSDFAVQEGMIAAKQASSEYIEVESETYILNKATEMGADVSVDVVLSDAELPVPNGITVCGLISPYVKAKLSACIRNDLGIAEDAQIWIS